MCCRGWIHDASQRARMMKIVVIDGHTLNPGDNPWTPLEQLGELEVYDRTPAEQVVHRSRDAEILVVNKVRMNTDTLQHLSRLRLIAVTATGHDCIDTDAASQRGIGVCNVPHYATEAVAQFVFAALLTLARQPVRHDRAVRDGEWARRGDFSFHITPQVELTGLSMGIVGHGRIGARVGELANAHGMRVIAYKPSPGEAPDYSPFVWRELDELVAEADVVSLHCPLTDQTRHLVDADMIRRFKAGSWLVNTARGGLVIERDLAAALESGHLAGAAMDVASSEPINADNPLLAAPRCLVTPHMAWATLTARKRLMRETAANIEAYQRGEARNQV